MKTLLLLVMGVAAAAGASCASRPAVTFASPDEAMRRLIKAGHDQAAADELLGAGGFELLRSGDSVNDRQDLDNATRLAQERLEFENIGEGRKLALLGNDRWEFPIPLVLDNGRWYFDLKAGQEEVLNRRVGRNELSTIATLRAIAEAQREYAVEGRDGNPPAFAKRLISTEGKRDGLYWPTAEAEEPSPLGPLVVAAFHEGYRTKEGEPVPYHGYFYRLLTSQGKSAPGGAKSYLDAQGQLTRGFAVVAWPSTYDNSGVKTFIVNQQGIVFEKNLGTGTAGKVGDMTEYDPDLSWAPVID